MKGRNPSASEKRYHDSLCQLVGCIACRAEGNFNSHVSVHHVDGRTKPMAHKLVLPLCGPHHQDQGIPGVIAVHPYKARFEAKYGKQEELIAQCAAILIEQGVEVPEELTDRLGVIA